MKYKLLLIVILIFTATEGNSQENIHVNITTKNYWNGLTNKPNLLNKIEINNDTDDDYITWVSLDSIGDKKNKQLVYEYFFRVNKGDFSLFNLIIEESLSDVPLQVGYTFFKKIKSKELFDYILLSENGNENENLFKGKIVLMKTKELYKYLKIGISEKYFYNGRELILID